MVWPGPSSRASRIAPAMLMPDEPPSSRPSAIGEVEDDRQRLLVRDLVGEVDRRAFEIGGDPALARCPSVIDEPDALRARLGVIGIERGAHRVGERDFDRRGCAP